MVDAGEFLGCRVGNDAATGEKNDARGEEERLAKIVGDEDNGFCQAARESAEFVLKLSASYRIECAERFVHEKNGRIGGEGARDADPLALAAGELMRLARCEFGGVETHQGEEFVHAGGGAGSIPFFEGGHEGDILGNAEMREKPRFLNNIADPAAEANRVPFRGGTSMDGDLAAGGDQKAIDELEEGGLATSAATEENESLAGRDGEANVANNTVVDGTVNTVCHVLERNGRVDPFWSGFRVHCN